MEPTEESDEPTDADLARANAYLRNLPKDAPIVTALEQLRVVITANLAKMRRSLRGEPQPPPELPDRDL
jgi:hypothetical protein